VIIWSKFMKERRILVGECRHTQKHRRAIVTKAAG